MTTATELKQKGNEAYAAKRFEEALKYYEEGLALDGGNIDLLNNAAAASFSLGRCEAAISFARRSLGVRDNFKAHKRVGEAFWKMGNLREAAAEYEKALALEPTDSSSRENLQKLRQEMNRGQAQFGGSPVVMPQITPHGTVGLLVDTLVLVLSFAALASSLIGVNGSSAWFLLLIAAAARHAVIAHSRHMLVPDLSILKSWFDVRCTLDLILCLVALISGVRAQLPLVVVQGLYSALSLATNFSRVQQVAPAAYQAGLRYAQSITSNAQRLIMHAVSLEAIMLLTVIFSGGAIFTLFYIQYAKNLYRIDGNVRLAFYGIRENLTQLARKGFMPAFVDSTLQRVCDTLYQFSQQPF
ncbi:TPR repeat/Tetratricopeptide repeat, putative [Trypanosoma equiperdum]|uniref:Uncharacterized protein n=2 Tax=Trypanozoon TaxID=39700 RepID=Q38E33_TRYB2|nr:hypothetical protein, conserved [Trypanosoma brucei brucei TREU927]EAN76937.1 hypothetical protein, conserved [Trypanosoma brucei brucei TREU927]SCU72479.1 TPR repeat/Tetratricopeptide repeat, putative [Trypanosoma equiperdum]